MSESKINPVQQIPVGSAAAHRGKFVIFGLGAGALVAWGALLALLALLAVGLWYSQRGPVQVGQMAPDFTLVSFDGQRYALADLRGKIVVLNFWASWCKPCEQEAADLEAAWRSYQPGGQVVFLGVAHVDTEPEAKGYLKKFDISFPNGPDLRTVISQAYRIRGVPETYFIDQRGKLAYIQIGPFSSLQQIRAVIEPLLGP